MQYIFWLLFFVGIPTAILWAWQPKLLWKYRRTLLWAMFWALAFSIPWDIYALKTHIWLFPPEDNLGLLVFGLPVEEFIFMAASTLMIGSVTVIAKYYLTRNPL